MWNRRALICSPVNTLEHWYRYLLLVRSIYITLNLGIDRLPIYEHARCL